MIHSESAELYPHDPQRPLHHFKAH